ncbi:hypothetical protein M413DRAFT_217093 [Hebeloma cylindrosporum]|uniref:WW domain-containing protein n=1 Tax=Hebeloma cylindrosporum TaxID=76867 RepID=A0A0C3CV29_HEBCY|nr:hypothetical protein M413DRAFT_217093 [Hebeloma cylindrosporum h7]
MQSSLTNPDRRPLREGWVSHFDPRRRLWYYINLNEAPPRTTYLHPDDEDPPSPTTPPMHIPPVSTVHPRQGTTPFSTASHAYRARHPTFAQQLYASATNTGQNTLPTPTNSDEDFEQASTYLTNISLPSNSPPEESNLFSTSPSDGYGPNPSPDPSSSLPSPPLSPLWSRPARRRPRGARSPTFPGPLPVAGPSFTLPPVTENQTACDIRDRALFNSLPSDPTPPSTSHNPQNIITFRHRRSATLPSMKSPVAQPLSVDIRSRPRETPMYSTVARPLETSPKPIKKSTPAFQNLSTLPAETTIPAAYMAVFPLSGNVGLPVIGALPAPAVFPPVLPSAPNLHISQMQSSLQPGNTCQPVPLTTPPVLGESRGDQEVENERKRKVLKKVGLAVGKSAGKMALRMGTKMALGSVGIPIDTSNMFSSDGDGVLNVITAGVSELAASAATAGVSQALKASTSPSSATNTSPPQSLTALSPQPTLTTSSQPSVDPNYAAILNQMQAMQLTQRQQNNPSQPVSSPAEYASILSQMQAMQMPNGIQRPSLPSSLPYQGVQPQLAVSEVNGAQSSGPPQNGSSQSHWQQNLMNTVIGGATHALVSSAVNNIDFTGAADAATSTFSDLASFDPYA